MTPFTPFQIKLALSVLGTLLIVLPGVVPALAPYAEILFGIGMALGGGAWIRRPGDAPASKPAKIVYSSFGLDSANPETLRAIIAKAEEELAAIKSRGLQ